MIALIDNYDSFVHNLARYVRRLGFHTEVIRNDAISVEALQAMRPAAIVISPGPCTPREAGISTEVVRRFHATIPILGVCLGHQTIAEALGGTVIRSHPAHGRSSLVRHDGLAEFAGLPPSFEAGRYHSLSVAQDTLPDELQVSAWLDDGTIMGIRHQAYRVYGWQFHPESVLTPWGDRLLRGLLVDMGLTAATLPTPLIDAEATHEVKQVS